jgi:hypothetical protein
VHVSVRLTAAVLEDGSVTLTHQLGTEIDMFGISANAGPKDRADILHQLPGWIVEKFRRECEDAIVAVKITQPK